MKPGGQAGAWWPGGRPAGKFPLAKGAFVEALRAAAKILRSGKRSFVLRWALPVNRPCRNTMWGGFMRIYTWNVNGCRAVLKKGFLEWLAAADPDVLCLQETRAEWEQVEPDVRARLEAAFDVCWFPATAKKATRAPPR